MISKSRNRKDTRLFIWEELGPLDAPAILSVREEEMAMLVLGILGRLKKSIGIELITRKFVD